MPQTIPQFADVQAQPANDHDLHVDKHTALVVYPCNAFSVSHINCNVPVLQFTNIIDL